MGRPIQLLTQSLAGSAHWSMGQYGEWARTYLSLLSISLESLNKTIGHVATHLHQRLLGGGQSNCCRGTMVYLKPLGPLNFS